MIWFRCVLAINLRASVPVSSPERASVPESSPERAPVPTPSPERAPVSTSSPGRASDPKSSSERAAIPTRQPFLHHGSSLRGLHCGSPLRLWPGSHLAPPAPNPFCLRLEPWLLPLSSPPWTQSAVLLPGVPSSSRASSQVHLISGKHF
uniref:Uncharacterized protein n=1 Tax=Sinocyclocheilus anshuiensis TaxID=1608454 RepID=A0A671LMJ4_9TELE